MNSFLQTPAGKAFALKDASHAHAEAHGMTKSHKALGQN